MKTLLSNIRMLRTEVAFLMARDENWAETYGRLATLQGELAEQLLARENDTKSDWFLVHVDGGPGRIIGQIEHLHLKRWCARKGRTLMSVRVANEMVNDLLTVME